MSVKDEEDKNATHAWKLGHMIRDHALLREINSLLEYTFFRYPNSLILESLHFIIGILLLNSGICIPMLNQTLRPTFLTIFGILVHQIHNL